MSPLRSRESASFAAASGKLSVTVLIPARSAISKKGCAVLTSEIGDRPDDALAPEIGIGKGRDIGHVNARADDLSALADRFERHGNERSHWSENDRCVEKDRRSFVG